MARLCRLTDIKSKAVVFVNPVMVRIVKSGFHGGTDIVFDDEQALTVSERVEDVVKALEANL